MKERFNPKPDQQTSVETLPLQKELPMVTLYKQGNDGQVEAVDTWYYQEELVDSLDCKAGKVFGSTYYKGYEF